MAEKYGRKVKRLMIDEMKKIFVSDKGFLISSQTNLSASDIDVLRAELRKSGSRYFVLKNRLARIALNESDLGDIGKMMEQDKTLGVSIITEDPVLVAKKIRKFSDDNGGFEVLSGYLEGRLLTEERVKELSELPSREELLAKVVGTMNAPISGLAMLMSTMLRNLLYVVKGIAEKKENDQSK